MRTESPTTNGGRWRVCVPVWCVPVLQHRSLELVRILFAITSDVASEEPLHRFDAHFGTAVAVGEGNGLNPVADTPVVEKGTRFVGGEFRSSIGG